MATQRTELEIGPGSVVFLPPRQEHAFQETSGRRPLCLVVDLDWRGAVTQGLRQARLTQAEATAIRSALARITRLPDPTTPPNRLLVAGAVLDILDVLLRGLAILPTRVRETPAFVRHFDRELQQADEPLPAIKTIAARMGYQIDYLNRIFKQATGQTLREYRDARLLEKAKRLLREDRRVVEVCETLGFLDQNYFARWFKKYTGVQPRAFASSGVASLGSRRSS